MKIYTIKTLKNNNDTWDMPDSIEQCYINQFIKKENKKILYAYLTMLYENKNYPTHIHSNMICCKIKTINAFYIIFYKNFFLDKYTLYEASQHKKEDIKKIQRLKKIKSLL